MDGEETDKDKYNHKVVCSEIEYAKNKLPCTHISLFNNWYEVTSSTNVIKAKLKEEMTEAEK